MENRITRAIDTFLDALNNGTLAKGTCVACAVGNLVAKGANAEIIKEGDFLTCDYTNTRWNEFFITPIGNKNQILFNIKEIVPFILDEALDNISKTEFSKKELAAIEFAFETNTKIVWNKYKNFSKEEIRQDQINGLKAVIQVMETFSPELTENYTEAFVNKAQLIPV